MSNEQSDHRPYENGNSQDDKSTNGPQGRKPRRKYPKRTTTSNLLTNIIKKY